MQSIAIRFGLKMYFALILLFLFVHFTGLSENYHLRYLNGIIHLIFLYRAISTYRKDEPASKGNYISGVALSMYMTMIGALLFAISIMIYLNLDSDFFYQLKDNFPYPQSFTPLSASIVILVEALAASIIGGYIVTRVIDKN